MYSPISSGLSLLCLNSTHSVSSGKARSEVRQRSRFILGVSEVAPGLLVTGRGEAIANVVQVDGEFRGVKGFAFAKVFAGCDDFEPGFQRHCSEFLVKKRIVPFLSCCITLWFARI